MLIQGREITHPDVTGLLRRAEAELFELYPDEPASPVHPRALFVVAYVMGQPVGCGAVVTVDETTVEIKRMFVLPEHRGAGIARRILERLIRRAREQHFENVILETGTKQEAAIALYESAGFERTEPYGEYVGNPYSICFLRRL